MKHIVKNLFFLLTFSLMGAGTMYAATAAKGVFTVNDEGKTVQFANANSIYRDTALIQWAHLGDVTDSGWDVLTGAEWSYLLASGRTNAANLNNLGTVNGQKGLIILPDGWVQPSGVPVFQPVDEGISYSQNQYTTAQWAVMAEAGAIFLPCAGYGHDPGTGYVEENTNDYGAYWAKDEVSGGSANANRVSFSESTIHDFTSGAKTNYYSVILVREVTVPQLYEEHEATDFATDLSAATGSPFVYVNRTMAKDNTLYTLCLPFDVPNVDASPLAGAEIYEFTGGHVSGSMGNERLHLNMKRLEGKRLTRGTPYILRWLKSGAAQNITRLCFYNVENWDDNTDVDTLPGDTIIKFQGVYPKAAIPGYTSGSAAHYNFFIGANDSLYWPDNTKYPTSMMKGFRAYFYIVSAKYPFPDPASAPARGLQAVWEVDGEPLDRTEGVESVQPSAVSIQKELREGQIILIIDGEMYDLQGRRL